MNTVFRAFIAMLAGTFGLGLIAAGVSVSSTIADADDRVYAKRDDDVREVAVVDDDADDDSKAGPKKSDTKSKKSKKTRSRSRASRDNTRSNVSRVSRDRDHSRWDLTRDWTRDGGKGHRDLKSNLTNDRSRHDTR